MLNVQVVLGYVPVSMLMDAVLRQVKMRSLFTIFFLLFPPTPSFFLCTAFLSHPFPFIFCISYPSKPLVLFSSWGKWEEYNGAASPEMRRE